MKIVTYPILNSFCRDGYCDNLKLVVNIWLQSQNVVDHEIEEFIDEDTGKDIDLDTLTESQRVDLNKFFHRLKEEWYMDLLQEPANPRGAR